MGAVQCAVPAAQWWGGGWAGVGLGSGVAAALRRCSALPAGLRHGPLPARAPEGRLQGLQPEELLQARAPEEQVQGLVHRPIDGRHGLTALRHGAAQTPREALERRPAIERLGERCRLRAWPGPARGRPCLGGGGGGALRCLAYSKKAPPKKKKVFYALPASKDWQRSF
jgi:hypothetical protein